MPRVELATLEHGMAILPSARSESCYGALPDQVVKSSLEISKHSWALMVGPRTIALWGVISPSMFSSVGYLWSTISKEVENHKVLVARTSKRAVRDLLVQYEKLETITNAEFPLADKWVRWLGFREVPSSKPDVRLYELERSWLAE